MTVNKDKYGTLNGYYKWDLAIDWLTHSNDSFYNNYGFTFTPKGELYEDVKQYLNELND